MSEKNSGKLAGLLFLTTVGAIGFGFWTGSIGAAVVVWVVLLHVNARLIR